ATGLLDLNGFSDTVGTADAVTALTVNSGKVQTGPTGTLTLVGDITTNAGVTVNPGPGNQTAVAAAVISGNLNLGNGYARTLNIGDRGELLVDAIISANLSGSADLFKQGGSGTLLLSGNNSGLSGSMFLNNNPGNNQPSVLVGSDTALGSGVVFPANTL